jgi:hypothetical protein
MLSASLSFGFIELNSPSLTTLDVGDREGLGFRRAWRSSLSAIESKHKLSMSSEVSAADLKLCSVLAGLLTGEPCAV